MENYKENYPPTVCVVRGRDLTSAELKLINTSRKLEFGSTSEITPEPDNEDWDKPYFLVRDGEDLAAFGRLHTIQAEFQSQPTTILGIATIVAIEKGKGYGRTLMEGMTEYIKASGLTAVGFCDPKNSRFYEKCGYSIIKNGVNRFTFLDAERQVIVPQYPCDDALYINGEDGLIENLEEQPNETVEVFRAAW